uniref:Integrase catalytic domain-containing protein n=1 Tax=Oncorhynchus tshawytscha TaxID=74940 RepID=A0A8C8HHV6_ONCTS
EKLLTNRQRSTECLRTTFARFGLPLQLVSDNAQAFVSDEFTRFMSVNGIKHSTSAQYHPATNGLAERFVQTLKQGLRAAKRDEGTLQTKLAKFLASYRNTPHATTNESPAALMFGRPLRTQLDIMKPNRRNEVLNKQAKMLSGGRERHLQTGQETRGTVHTQTGPRTYQVQVSPDIMWRRHINQMHSMENTGTGTAHTEDVQEPPDNQRPYPERRHRPPDTH